jgi:hypothetical protein
MKTHALFPVLLTASALAFIPVEDTALPSGNAKRPDLALSAPVALSTNIVHSVASVFISLLFAPTANERTLSHLFRTVFTVLRLASHSILTRLAAQSAALGLRLQLCGAGNHKSRGSTAGVPSHALSAHLKLRSNAPTRTELRRSLHPNWRPFNTVQLTILGWCCRFEVALVTALPLTTHLVYLSTLVNQNALGEVRAWTPALGIV